MKIIFQVLDSCVKNAVPIKDINSILEINKKLCSQVYLGECDFINKND